MFFGFSNIFDVLLEFVAALAGTLLAERKLRILDYVFKDVLKECGFEVNSIDIYLKFVLLFVLKTTSLILR